MKLVRLSKEESDRIRLAVADREQHLRERGNSTLADWYRELMDRLYEGGDIWVEEEGE